MSDFSPLRHHAIAESPDEWPPGDVPWFQTFGLQAPPAAAAMPTMKRSLLTRIRTGWRGAGWLTALILGLALPLAAEAISFASYRLVPPSGYVHEPGRGIDSDVGTIRIAGKGIEVKYDIGDSAGLKKFVVGKMSIEQPEIERVETLRTPVGTAQFAVGKAEGNGQRKFFLSVPPHANFRCIGPEAETEAAFKTFASRLALKTPVPPGLAAALSATRVNDGKQVKITIVRPDQPAAGQKLQLGQTVLSKVSLYADGKWQENRSLQPRKPTEVLIEADRAASATVVIEAAVADKTGVRRGTFPVAVAGLLENPKKE